VNIKVFACRCEFAKPCKFAWIAAPRAIEGLSMEA
jgi:hypothetical protein